MADETPGTDQVPDQQAEAPPESTPPTEDAAAVPAAQSDQPAAFGGDQVQQAHAAAQEQGHFGESVDPTPNHNYTVRGVLEGAPTPETDPVHAAQVQADLRQRQQLGSVGGVDAPSTGQEA